MLWPTQNREGASSVDGSSFDRFARQFAAQGSRRWFISRIAAITGGAAVAGRAGGSVSAASRSAPQPRAQSCPGNQQPCDSGCCCPAGSTNCGAECCSNGAVCCDGACCNGKCYGEELCCPTGRDYCDAVGQCCLYGQMCFGERGCLTSDGLSCDSNANCPAREICDQETHLCICAEEQIDCGQGCIVGDCCQDSDCASFFCRGHVCS